MGTLYHEKQCTQVPPARIFSGRISAAEIVCNSLVKRDLRDVERRRGKEYVFQQTVGKQRSTGDMGQQRNMCLTNSARPIRPVEKEGKTVKDLL